MPADDVTDQPEPPAGLDRFGAVLVLASLTIGGMSLFDLFSQDTDDANRFAATIVGILIGATLVMAARASGVARRALRFITLFVTIVVVISIVSLVVRLVGDGATPFDTDRPSPVWALIAIATPIYVVRRLIRHRRVTRQTLYGAVSAYLLIAIGFAYLFMFVADIDSDAFFASTDDQSSTAFAYFSLTTITTLGYGDLSPATDVARFLATTEALVGQVYLVTFVAMTVGLFIAQRETD